MRWWRVLLIVGASLGGLIVAFGLVGIVSALTDTDMSSADRSDTVLGDDAEPALVHGGSCGSDPAGRGLDSDACATCSQVTPAQVAGCFSKLARQPALQNQ